MNTMKALFRSLLVMLFLWMISLLVYYWPLPEEVLQLGEKAEQEQFVQDGEPSRRVRMLPLD
jgi:hypothetical protein